jgi:lysophospholipase L1-like esterase
MPSGDSITMGSPNPDRGGYRVPLFRLMLDDNRLMTFVGPSGVGPGTVDGVPFPDAHDGHSGYVIDTIDTRKGLTPLMEDNLANFTPHIVLLMIGTNDINAQLDLPNAPARLTALVDLVTTTAPDTLLVVAQIVPTREDALNSDVEAFNAAVAGIVAERAAAGRHILLVDMYGAFTANADYKSELLADGLHPSDAGYAVMAQVWHDAIDEFLY